MRKKMNNAALEHVQHEQIKQYISMGYRNILKQKNDDLS